MTVPQRWFRTAKHYYQRITQGFSFQDLWSLDAHLLDLMIRSLKAFNESNKATPQGMTSEEWTETLNKIISGLESGVALSNGDFSYQNKAERLQQEFEESMCLLGKHFFNLWY